MMGMDKESMIEHDSVQNSTMTDDNGDADDSDEDGDNNSDANSEVVGFNVALFPTSSLFGPNMFQKLQESLRVIRDQLNNMWTMSNNTSNFMDIPDDYRNSTSKTQIINGTVVTVNETITKKNEDGVQSVYHVRVISLRPENDTDSSSVQQQQMGQQKVALPTTSSPTTTDVTTMAAATTTVAPVTSTTIYD
jgi:hypothetical protein